MAARNRRRRCRNCPDEPELPPPQPESTATPVSERESEKLWRLTLYGCSSVLETLFGFVAMDMPGDPLPALRRLHARLGEIIQTREERFRENPGSAK